MPSSRIVTAGAVISLISGLLAGAAAAQTTTSETPGKPLQLLRITAQPNKPKTKSHNQRLSKRIGKVRAAVAKHNSAPPAQTASATPPANAAPATRIWPEVNQSSPTDVVAAAALPQFVPTASAPAHGELVVGGQTVRVTSPDDFNELDLAANDPFTEAAEPSSTPMTPAATSDSAGAEPKSDKSEAVKATLAQPQGSPVGSTSWILQVMAAFGGAVAAGSVAWFLIGSTPQRTYG